MNEFTCDECGQAMTEYVRIPEPEGEYLICHPCNEGIEDAWHELQTVRAEGIERD